MTFLMTASITLISCKSTNPVKPSVPVKTVLEGTWVGRNRDGIDQTEYTYKMAFDSIYIDTNTLEKYRGTFTLDTTMSSRQINIIVTKSSTNSDVGKKIPALYTISGGNILLITANSPGSQRPPNMDSPVPVLSLTLQE
jgi:hypothetical protein